MHVTKRDKKWSAKSRPKFETVNKLQQPGRRKTVKSEEARSCEARRAKVRGPNGQSLRPEKP